MASAAADALVRELGEEMGKRAAEALQRAKQAQETPILAQDNFEGLVWEYVAHAGCKLKQVESMVEKAADALLGAG
eukprot:gene717-9062_t